MSSKKAVRKSKLNKRLSSKFHDFLEIHPPAQVNRHLRSIALDYISSQIDNGFPADFSIYIWELYDLFELLDCASDEFQS